MKKTIFGIGIAAFLLVGGFSLSVASNTGSDVTTELTKEKDKKDKKEKKKGKCCAGEKAKCSKEKAACTKGKDSNACCSKKKEA